MKTKILLLAIVLGNFLSAKSQTETVKFTYTAVDSAAYIKLDSIKVMNRTRYTDTMIYWPDTTLLLGITQGDLLLHVGYTSSSPEGFQETNVTMKYFKVFQNYPNPMHDFTLIPVYIPKKGNVNCIVTDILGRKVLNTSMILNGGYHTFRLSPGYTNVLFFTVQWNNIIQGIKIISAGPNSGSKCTLEYAGNEAKEFPLKASALAETQVRQSGITDNPVSNKTYTFQFAVNIPCRGTETVNYEGMVYNTIQIYSQCWLRQNMNVGTEIPGTQEMTNNEITEKYCYNNQTDSCFRYGGLYQWDEAMQYSDIPGSRGICPPGWHIPTDEEWKVLQGSVDSQFGIGDPPL